jgi:energy-coupling factor transport system ATP-binding protein
MTAAVSFEGVTFSYPDSAPTLIDASFDIPEGCFVLVCGVTGSGKSTLLRCINGLVPHFSGGTFDGRVVTQGRDTRSHVPRELSDVVAFVPQSPSASFVLDVVEDELAYALENLGVDRSTMRRRVEETLDLLGLEPLRNRSVRTLSGGEAQRVAIAAALTTSPRVLVLDEPTSQLDPQGAEDVLAALQRLVHDLGLTVVIAEHRLERVAGFADLAIGTAKGTPPRVGDPGDVIPVVTTGPPVADLGRLLGWAPVPLTVRDARRFEAPALDIPERSPTDPGDVSVEAKKLHVSYGEVKALRAVDLELRAGETVALTGRNGSGKTTLLRALAGLVEPTSGNVRSRGTSPRPGRDVALLPQMPETVLFSDSVSAEIAATVGASRSSLEVADMLESLGISELAERHPRDLSAGERLLVAVGAVAATDAPVLLLDEPTRGLDPDSKARLRAFFDRWTDRGHAVMFATHDVELAASAADRVVMLAKGEVISQGSPEEVLGDSPVFAPQVARVLGPRWLTPGHVAAALGLGTR